jgi:hypothetical protein
MKILECVEMYLYFHAFAAKFVKCSDRLATLSFATTEFEMKRRAMSYARRKSLLCRSGLNALQASTGPPFYSARH